MKTIGKIFFINLILSFGIFSENIVVPVELNDTIITAEKFEISTNEVQKSTYIIYEDEIKNSGARNVVDILKKIPSIFTGSGYTNEGVIDFRGQGETAKSNVLIMIDGISQNSIDMSGADLGSININDIRRIEIISSGGVLYGDKAVGGVINIITKNNLNYAKSEFGSFGYKNYGVSINKKMDKFHFGGNYFITRKNGHRDNSGIAKNNYNINFGFNSDLIKLDMDYKYNEGEYQLPGSLTEREVKEDRTQSLYSLYENWSLKERIDNKDIVNLENKKYSASLNINLNELIFSNDFSYFEKKSMTTWTHKTKTNSNTENIINNSKIKLDLGSINLISGIDYKNASSRTSNEDNEISKIQIGIFALTKFDFSKNSSLNLGYRKEDVTLNYFNDFTKKFNENLYSIGINNSYSYTGNLYASIEQNYRTPVTDEYYNSWTKEFNEDLIPQKNRSIEIGLKDYKLYTFFSSNIFYSETEKEIYYNPSTFFNTNMDSDILRKGIELSSDTEIGNWKFMQSYSFIRVNINNSKYRDKKLPWVPENRYRLGINYNLKKLSIGSEYLYTDEVYSISDWDNIYDKVDSYYVINMNIKYILNKITIYSGIKNILNQEYYDYVTYGINYYPAEKRNYFLGVDCNF